MFNLSSYLEKFKSIKNPNEDKKSVLELILQETGVDISEGEIKIQNNKVVLSVSSIYRNAIFLKKEPLLVKIQERIPEIKDIF